MAFGRKLSTAFSSPLSIGQHTARYKRRHILGTPCLAPPRWQRGTCRSVKSCKLQVYKLSLPTGKQQMHPVCCDGNYGACYFPLVWFTEKPLHSLIIIKKDDSFLTIPDSSKISNLLNAMALKSIFLFAFIKIQILEHIWRLLKTLRTQKS